MKWNNTFLVLLSLLLVIGSSHASEFEYLIGYGDVLKITVYDNPDLTTIAQVDSSGNILFPLAGQVNIGGLTSSQVADKIAAALSGDYLLNPQVSVFIEEFRSKNVVISGQVVKPGLYEMRGPTTLFELISLAGGLKGGAGLDVTIHRAASPDHPDGQMLTVNLKALLEESVNAVDVYLKDGDSVTIPSAGVVYVSGEVNKPAAYRLEEQDATVIMAITKAGGFTELAAKGKVRIIRKIDGKEVVLKNVSMYELLKPNDVVIVPESFF